MSGAPRGVFTAGEFVAVRREAVQALGSWEAAGVWHRICWRSDRDGSWVATVAEIAEDCCLSEHKTKQALKVIRDKGWVTARRASHADRTLQWFPVWVDGADSPEGNDESGTYLEGDSPSTPSSKTVETTDTESLFSTSDVRARAKGPSAAEVAAQFDHFWGLYPRKTGKGRARGMYAKARKKASAQQIVAGLRAQYAEMMSKDLQYVPHPATWLNEERWEDVPLPTTNVHPIRPQDQPTRPADIPVRRPNEMFG